MQYIKTEVRNRILASAGREFAEKGYEFYANSPTNQIFIVLSALLGLYGLMIGLFLMITQLCSMKSFGVPYLSPVSPHRRHNPDIILRLPVWMQRRVMYFVQPDSWMCSTECATRFR